MKVSFNPVVNFKSNLIDERLKNATSAMVENPVTEIKEEVPVQEDAIVQKEEADKFESRNLTQDEKIADFTSTLKDKKWEKKYLPESEIVFVKQKKVEDDVEYMIEKDGTVKEVGANMKPEVIMEANSKMAEVFNDIKAKQSSASSDKKAGNWFTRGISDLWTAMSVAGTMTVATAKGLFYGALTGAGVIGVSTILNMSKLMGENQKFFEILKHPVRSAGRGEKIAAAAASIAVLASYLISGKLTANENAAVIDHKMHTGHRDA